MEHRKSHRRSYFLHINARLLLARIPPNPTIRNPFLPTKITKRITFLCVRVCQCFHTDIDDERVMSDIYDSGLLYMSHVSYVSVMSLISQSCLLLWIPIVQTLVTEMHSDESWKIDVEKQRGSFQKKLNVASLLEADSGGALQMALEMTGVGPLEKREIQKSARCTVNVTGSQ